MAKVANTEEMTYYIVTTSRNTTSPITHHEVVKQIASHVVIECRCVFLGMQSVEADSVAGRGTWSLRVGLLNGV